LFDFIYTNRNLFGKHETMKKIITKENCPSVIYVGDEVRDVEAMRILEIPVISVDWGLSSRNSLLKINPDYVVSLAPEVLQKIQILENILV
jgi:phosphoglycolate phosphatase